MQYTDILYEVKDKIATITLNRPEIKNAFTLPMRESLIAALDEASKDDEVKVAILTGAGRHFCAGGNVREIATRQVREVETAGTSRISERALSEKVIRSLVGFEKPLIASINGAAAGGGMDVCSMCDIRIAADTSKFTMAYVRMGVAPGLGGAYFLPRIVGVGKALELIWTGRMMMADEALRVGYVNMVVPLADLPLVTRDFAMQLVDGPATAHRLAKKVVHQAMDLDFEAGYKASEEAFLQSQKTRDAKEGPKAFLEKRAPDFQGQ